jgi:hypothetical protein
MNGRQGAVQRGYAGAVARINNNEQRFEARQSKSRAAKKSGARSQATGARRHAQQGNRLRDEHHSTRQREKK